MRSGERMAVIFPSVIIAGMIVDHLAGYKEDGTDVIGIYPLLPDGTCRFLVFDFDKFKKFSI